MKFSDAAMSEAVRRYRRFKTADDFYREIEESPDFRECLEAAYARGVRDPAQNFIHLDAAGWYPAQFCASVIWPDTSGKLPDPPPERALTDVEIRLALAAVLAEVRALEAETDKTRLLSPFRCSVQERLDFLKAALPPIAIVAEASRAMAPPNVPQTWKPYAHSGFAGYSDETHVGRVELASGKREDNFRVWRKPISEK